MGYHSYKHGEGVSRLSLLSLLCELSELPESRDWNPETGMVTFSRTYPNEMSYRPSTLCRLKAIVMDCYREMTSTCPSFRPFKLGGTSNFSDEAYYSHEMFDAFSTTILETLESVSPSLDQPFVIADYGAADGGASYNIIRQCIAQLRRRYGPGLPIHVIYEDQPVNDFQPAFARADGLLPGSEGLSSEFGNVYVTACGTSFYRQCLPDNSLDFVFSSTSIHWLSRCPVEMPQDLFPNLTTPPLREQFQEQAKLDLESFIRHRERELKSGGRLILINVECYPERAYLPEITDAWRSLVSEGTITQAEFSNTNIAMYFRTVEEWTEAFKAEKTKLKQTSSQSSEVHWGRDIIGEAGSLENFGRSAVRTIRSWTDCNLYNGLSDERSHAQKMDVLDTYYKTLLCHLIAKGKSSKRTLSVFCMVLEKS